MQEKNHIRSGYENSPEFGSGRTFWRNVPNSGV